MKIFVICMTQQYLGTSFQKYNSYKNNYLILALSQMLKIYFQKTVTFSEMVPLWTDLNVIFICTFRYFRFVIKKNMENKSSLTVRAYCNKYTRYYLQRKTKKIFIFLRLLDYLQLFFLQIIFSNTFSKFHCFYFGSVLFIYFFILKFICFMHHNNIVKSLSHSYKIF